MDRNNERSIDSDPFAFQFEFRRFSLKIMHSHSMIPYQWESFHLFASFLPSVPSSACLIVSTYQGMQQQESQINWKANEL